MRTTIILLGRGFAAVALALVWFSASGCSNSVVVIADSRPDGDGNRRALLVGINDYQAVNKLRGCVNDVQNMMDLLVGKFDFPKENVMVLTDRQATRAGILKAFEEHLIAKADNDSIIVFHYSGHGSRMKDPADLTPSGLISTIVPQDSRTEGVYDINADELRGLFVKLAAKKAKNLTFILDSCHSGLAFKGEAVVRSVETDRRPPPPPSELAKLAPPRGRGLDDGLKGRNYSLLSACQPDEVAFEYWRNDRSCGTLTYFLAAELRRVDKNGAGVTYRDVMDQVKAMVSRVYKKQHPELEGANMDNFVFDCNSSVPQPFVLASPQRDDVTLAAGAAQGVTKGSVFDVYPPGTKTFETPSKATARVEVVNVNDYDSQAKRLEGGPVAQASRAVEREHNFGERRVRLFFDRPRESATLGRIKAAIEGTDYVDAANEKSPKYREIFTTVAGGAEAQLVLRETKVKKGPEMIVISAADSVPLSSPVPADDPQAVSLVLRQLTRWAEWFNLLDLENPDARQLKIEFTVTLVVAPGTRDPRLTGKVELTVPTEREMEYAVKNLSDKEVYFAILDLASDGTVGVVYPGEGRNDVLPPGRIWKQRSQTFLPKELERARDFIKVFATPTQVDFSFLRKEGGKGLPRDVDDPLVKLLGEAQLIEKHTKPIRARVDGWTTRTQVFDVVRPGGK